MTPHSRAELISLVPEVLRYLREKSHRTLEQVSKKSRIPVGALIQLEAGKLHMTLRVFFGCLDAYGLGLAEAEAVLFSFWLLRGGSVTVSSRVEERVGESEARLPPLDGVRVVGEVH